MPSMLELHRASAGSGKTYTLAKKYIWYLITISEEGGPRRLRTDEELKDSARHILAITFTNKATNEMQMRIIDRLFDLANKQPVYDTRKDGTRFIDSPDYLEEFTTTLEVTPEQIAEISRKALRLLLEHYSDFNVSTIDSFFQLVLRTLAYESDLADNYQIEIDSNYLSYVAVDSTLEEIDTKKTDNDVKYWLSVLMKREKKAGWNIFSRSDRSNAYKQLIESVRKLENEEYKVIRKEIDEYLRSGVDLRGLYEGLAKKYEEPLLAAFKKMREAFRKNIELFPPEFLTEKSGSTKGKMISNQLKIAALKDKDFENTKEIFEAYDKLCNNKTKLFNTGAKGKDLEMLQALGTSIPEIIADLDRCDAIYKEWYDIVSSPEYQHWKLYAVNIPYLALFGIINEKRLEFLDELNAVELGETNMILRGIIGETDTPFVYERIGTVLKHFLIDEFQDTSRLQWENLRPLLSESVPQNESLIIGDAKQSIYRFRNADPSLISNVVPETFNPMLVGDDPERNTNHRSCLRIVQFNNSFFEYFTRSLDESQADNRMKFSPLYANVVQTPRHRDPEGYVEVNISDTKGSYSDFVIERVPQLIEDMLARGYQQKDIAVLITSNDNGQDVIRSFMAYNAAQEDTSKHIRFVSEVSLKVNSSPAVGLITGVLENMVRGFEPVFNDVAERSKKGVANWTDIKTDFAFFSMAHSEMSVAARLDEYIRMQPDMSVITDMLSSMQSLAIPAIVEAVIANFIPEEMRREEAIYLSAFQDLVLEYCDGNPTDVGSFLRWWDRHKDKAAITSPEDTDAVQVLTIHKSKGLEFGCVIVPFANWDMADVVDETKKEWRWVKPSAVEHDEYVMPPYVPVATSAQMEDTAHADRYYDFLDHKKMDYLNTAYVAFTRAERELYILCNAKQESSVQLKPKKETTTNKGKVDIFEAPKTPKLRKICGYLFDFMNGDGDEAAADDMSRLHKDEIVVEEREEDSTTYVATFGSKEQDIKAMRRKKAAEREAKKRQLGVVEQELRPKPRALGIDEYNATLPELNRIQYRKEDAPVVEPGEEEDLDPRSEGNVKHAILENVRTVDDLDAAVRHVWMRGIVTREIAETYGRELREALVNCPEPRWFDGTAKVLNERPLLRAGYVSRRPDRILIHDDGSVEVIDYKFGVVPNGNKHKKQVANYVRLLKQTGHYPTVTAHLWYVNQQTVVDV